MRGAQVQMRSWDRRITNHGRMGRRRVADKWHGSRCEAKRTTSRERGFVN